MKVYVAASSREMDRARDIFRGVEASPELVIAADWISQIEDHDGIANPSNVPEALRHKWATDAIVAVMNSSVLWLLLPEEPTVGAWCEMTAAVAFDMTRTTRRLIVTSGSDKARYQSIFTSLAHRHFGTDAEALSAIRMYAKSI